MVEVKVSVDAAGPVFGLPDEHTGQGQDDKHDDAGDDPFHDLIYRPKDRFDQAVGFGVTMTMIHKTIW